MQHEHSRMFVPTWSRSCGAVAAAGLAGLSLFLAFEHRAPEAEVQGEALDATVSPAEADAWRTGDYILDFVEPEHGEGGSEAEIDALVAALDADPAVAVASAGFYSEGEHLYRLEVSPEVWPRVAERLAREPLIEGFEPEVVYAAFPAAASALDAGAAVDEVQPAKPPRFDPDDPMFHYQWHMEQIRAPEAWASSARGEGVIVAVIDTGVAWRTEAGVRQLPDLAQTRFVSGESFVAGLPAGLDDHAHGSHVAGTIAQSTNNGVGVTGVAYQATIMPLKVLAKDGRGSVPGIANAIRYAADHGAHVINMSLGGPLPSNVLAKAIEYAHQKGVTVVCAAGNESRSRVGYPAANNHAIAVSATNYERGISFYSNWGTGIDVAAPGGDTRSDKNGDGKPDGVLQNTIAIQNPAVSEYLWFQGTSMASPHAAGVAALIVGEGVTHPDEVERVLKKSAKHPHAVEWDKYYGAGIVDAEAAVAMAQSQYAPERAGLLGFLGLGILGAVRPASSGSGSRWRSWLQVGAGALLASGALGTPLAYALGGAVGGVALMSSALWMSVALPFLLAVLLLGRKSLRPLLLGVSLGYAAMLLHGAAVLPTLLDSLPGGPLVDRLWLGVQGLLAALLALRIRRLG